jgi:hypothetical protein
MLMLANWEELLLALLLLPPGLLYYSTRARVLKRAEMESPSTDRGWLDVLLRMMILGFCLQLLAAIIVSLAFWLLLSLAKQQNWLDSLQFDTSLPKPGPMLKESLGDVRDYASSYTESHWQLLLIAGAMAYLLANLLGWFMGRKRARKTIYQAEIQREADEVSNARHQDDLSTAQSQVMIRLKNGTVYSGNLPGGSRRQPVVGKEELVLRAPIKVRIKGIDKNLRSESLAVKTSEIASLSLLDGNHNRLFVYSDAVPGPWIPS